MSAISYTAEIEPDRVSRSRLIGVTPPEGAEESDSAWLSRLNKPITDFDCLGFAIPPYHF